MDAKQEFVQSSLDEAYKVWLRRILFVYCAVVVLSVATDFLSARDVFRDFFIQRLFILCITFVFIRIQIIFHLSPIRFHIVGTFVIIVIYMALLDVRILATGGHLSNYYTGMLALGILFIGFLPARLYTHLSIALLLYFLYLVPLLLFDDITNIRVLLVKTVNTFILFTILIVIRVSFLRMQISELGMQ